MDEMILWNLGMGLDVVTRSLIRRPHDNLISTPILLTYSQSQSEVDSTFYANTVLNKIVDIPWKLLQLRMTVPKNKLCLTK